MTHRISAAALAAAVLLCPLVLADSNVAIPKKHVWTENVGWTNWRDADSAADGVRIYRESHLEGWIWAENVGWIHVGNGAAPYDNTDGTNYGVNIDDATGEMTGFAWGENVGWINFGPFPPATPVASASWDFANHRITGWAWAENIGWLNLDDADLYICSPPGDNDYDGAVTLADFSTLASNFGAAGVTPFTMGDGTGDGNVTLADFTELATNFGFTCP